MLNFLSHLLYMWQNRGMTTPSKANEISGLPLAAQRAATKDAIRAAVADGSFEALGADFYDAGLPKLFASCVMSLKWLGEIPQELAW